MDLGTSMVTESSQTATSVTLPPDLLAEAQRIAGEESWTVSQAVVFLVKRGVEIQRKAEAHLEKSYAQFMADPQNTEAGDQLIACIFGPDALAKD